MLVLCVCYPSVKQYANVRNHTFSNYCCNFKSVTYYRAVLMATRHLSLLHSPQCEHTQVNLHHELDDYYNNSFIVQATSIANYFFTYM